MAVPTRVGILDPDQLRPLLAPRSIAVVGASESVGSAGGHVLKNLGLQSDATVYAIHPSAKEVFGTRAVKSIAMLPEPIDLVAIAVRRELAVDIARDAAKAGARGALIYSSGFAETGTEEGAAAERALAALAETGFRIFGPNSMGYVNVRERLELQFTDAYGTRAPLTPGGIGVVSQSGGLGFVLLEALNRGVGFSYGLMPGNSCDVDVVDAVNYLLEDDATRVIILVMEGLNDGSRLIELAKRTAASGKAVLVHKMGNSPGGVAAARSHTGVLAGSQAVYAEVFESGGMIQVDHFDALIETAVLFERAGRRSTRGGVGVLAGSGGATVMSADEAHMSGVELPHPSDGTVADMARLAPDFASIGNPADVTSQAVKDPAMYKQCIRSFCADENFDAVVVPLSVAIEAVNLPKVEAIIEVAREHPRSPIIVVWLSEWIEAPGVQQLERDPNVTVVRSMRRAMAALKQWQEWCAGGDRLARWETEQQPAGLLGAQAAKAADLVVQYAPIAAAVTASAEVVLNEVEVKEVLRASGVAATSPIIVDPTIIGQVQFDGLLPAAVKVLSRHLSHKSHAGGVILNVASSHGVAEAVRELRVRFGDLDDMRVIVEPMVSGLEELFVGVRRDPSFGTVLVLGRGGTDVESHETMLIVGRTSVLDIQRRLSTGDGLLAGRLRENPALSHALTEVCVRLLRLFEAAPLLRELDVNPLLFTDEGQLVAVDGYAICDV